MNQGEPGNVPLRGRKREALGNDEAILNAAREVFSENGWNAPMSKVAERAGAGVASIYRRYPSKAELVNAIRVSSLDRVCALADVSFEEAESAGKDSSGIELFLREHVRNSATPFVLTVGSQVVATDEILTLSDGLKTKLERLIALDVERGLAPSHYGPADLLLTVTHLRPRLVIEEERSTEFHLRQLEYVIRGLRIAARERLSLPGTPATWDEWLRMNGVG